MALSPAVSPDSFKSFCANVLKISQLGVNRVCDLIERTVGAMSASFEFPIIFDWITQRNYWFCWDNLVPGCFRVFYRRSFARLEQINSIARFICFRCQGLQRKEYLGEESHTLSCRSPDWLLNQLFTNMATNPETDKSWTTGPKPADQDEVYLPPNVFSLLYEFVLFCLYIKFLHL